MSVEIVFLYSVKNSPGCTIAQPGCLMASISGVQKVCATRFEIPPGHFRSVGRILYPIPTVPTRRPAILRRSGEIIDYAISLDIIKKSGSWFSYNGERIGQGKDNVRKMIENDPAFLAELDAKVRAMKDSLPEDDSDFELDDDDDDFDIRTIKEDEEF